MRAGVEITVRGAVTERAPLGHEVALWLHASDGVLLGVGSATVRLGD
jgi:hypothetical protein